MTYSFTQKEYNVHQEKPKARIEKELNKNNKTKFTLWTSKQ